MKTERLNYPVKVMSRVLEVSRSGFYAWLKRKPSCRKQENAKLEVAIRAEHKASRETYGPLRLAKRILKVSVLICIGVVLSNNYCCAEDYATIFKGGIFSGLTDVDNNLIAFYDVNTGLITVADKRGKVVLEFGKDLSSYPLKETEPFRGGWYNNTEGSFDLIIRYNYNDNNYYIIGDERNKIQIYNFKGKYYGVIDFYSYQGADIYNGKLYVIKDVLIDNGKYKNYLVAIKNGKIISESELKILYNKRISSFRIDKVGRFFYDVPVDKKIYVFNETGDYQNEIEYIHDKVSILNIYPIDNKLYFIGYYRGQFSEYENIFIYNLTSKKYIYNKKLFRKISNYEYYNSFIIEDKYIYISNMFDRIYKIELESSEK